MPILRKKSRVITFRVEGDEYLRLENAWQKYGARSLADFARSAVVEKIQSMGAPSLSLSRDLATLGKGLGELDAALKETSARIRRLLGPADPGSRQSEQKSGAGRRIVAGASPSEEAYADGFEQDGETDEGRQ